MEIHYPKIGEPWRYDLHARRYGFLLSHTINNPVHTHNHFELGYILQGTIEHTFLDTVTVLKPGDMFFIDIGIPHGYVGSADHKILNFLFYPEVLDSSYQSMTGLAQIAGSPTFRFNSEALPLLNRPVFHDEDGSFLQHLEQIQQEIQEKKPGHHQMEHTLIQQLIIRLMRIDCTARSDIYDIPLVQQILSILGDRYSTDITLKEISQSLDYSSAHISRLFRKYFNTTFSNYLQQTRLSKSCHLLLETDWSIAKVAAAVGYNNVQFFHQIFKKRYRLTPLQYRKIKRSIR